MLQNDPGPFLLKLHLQPLSHTARGCCQRADAAVLRVQVALVD